MTLARDVSHYGPGPHQKRPWGEFRGWNRTTFCYVFLLSFVEGEEEEEKERCLEVVVVVEEGALRVLMGDLFGCNMLMFVLFLFFVFCFLFFFGFF